MTAERKYFLNVVSDYINGMPTYAPDADVSFDKLAEIAISQSLSGIVYAQCKDFLPKNSDAFEKLKNGFTSSIFHYVCFNDEAKKLKSTFGEAGIEFLPFKGLSLARYHRVPELRTMGDLDILIHPADRKIAHKLMLSQGYECKETGDAVWAYKHDVVRVEVHERMIYESLSNNFDYAGYFDGVWNFAKNGELDPNMQFLFLLTHTAKHILDRGCGFRPFLDMVFMAKNAELDWDFVNAELQKIKLSDFAKVSFALCRRWFNVELPLDCAEISEEFFEQATQKAFFDGIFGFGNTSNAGAYMAKDIKRKGGGRKTAFAIALRKLFPKENSMPHKRFYSFLFRNKALRPIAWVYRIFYCAVTKLPHSLKMLVYPFRKKKEIESRHSFIESWGL